MTADPDISKPFPATHTEPMTPKWLRTIWKVCGNLVLFAALLAIPIGGLYWVWYSHTDHPITGTAVSKSHTPGESYTDKRGGHHSKYSHSSSRWSLVSKPECWKVTYKDGGDKKSACVWKWEYDEIVIGKKFKASSLPTGEVVTPCGPQADCTGLPVK
jgi:hypothetical protein